MPIDHVGIQVAETDLATTVAFYTAALAPLGYKEMMRFPTASGTTAVGLGSGAHSDFWITGMAEKANTNTHVGFRGGEHASFFLRFFFFFFLRDHIPTCKY